MKIVSKVDPQSERAVKEMLKAAGNVIGATSSEFVAIVAHKTAHRLAHKVQPFGFKKLDKFAGSVKAQVYKSLHNAIREGDSSAPGQAHQKRRNSRGRIPRDIQTKGQYRRAPFSEAEFQQVAKNKVLKIGYAKGSWIEAGDEAGIGEIPNVPNVVRRHARNGSGYSQINRTRFKPQTTIASRVPYMRRLISNASIASALNEGRRNALKYLDQQTRKRLRHVERIQKKAARENARAVAKFNKRAAREWAKRHKIQS
jgi:hypothetical protein